MASLWRILAGGATAAASIAASPFTGGASLAGLSVVPSILGSGKPKTPAATDPNAPPTIDSLIGKQSTTANNLISGGDDLAAKGEAGVDLSLNHLTKVLSGDRATVTNELAPEYDQILGQYDTARRNIMQTGPRGGGKGEAVAESFFKQADTTSRVTSEARSGAAEKIAAISGARASRGAATRTTGIAALDNILQALTAKRGQTMATYGQVGEGLGAIVASLLKKATG